MSELNRTLSAITGLADPLHERRVLPFPTTVAEAQAIADEAGSHGAALMEIATLAERRVHALRCKEHQG